MTYTVTSEDGSSSQDWQVTVKEAEEALNTETDILTFSLAQQTESSTINDTDHTVSIEVEFGTDVTSLTPDITLSEGATSDPVSGAAVNFTEPVTYNSNK